jgi:hypothetical protein
VNGLRVVMLRNSGVYHGREYQYDHGSESILMDLFVDDEMGAGKMCYVLRLRVSNISIDTAADHFGAAERRAGMIVKLIFYLRQFPESTIKVEEILVVGNDRTGTGSFRLPETPVVLSDDGKEFSRAPLRVRDGNKIYLLDG